MTGLQTEIVVAFNAAAELDSMARDRRSEAAEVAESVEFYRRELATNEVPPEVAEMFQAAASARSERVKSLHDEALVLDVAARDSWTLGMTLLERFRSAQAAL